MGEEWTFKHNQGSTPKKGRGLEASIQWCLLQRRREMYLITMQICLLVLGDPKTLRYECFKTTEGPGEGGGQLLKLRTYFLENQQALFFETDDFLLFFILSNA